jgi:hypothetical protein
MADAAHRNRSAIDWGAVADRLFVQPASERARGSLAAVADRNPDAEADLQRNASALGLAVDSARANLVEVQRRMSAAQVDPDFARTRPRTTRFLGETSRAAIAQDDIGVLGRIEGWFKDGLNSIASSIDSAIMDERPLPARAGNLARLARGAFDAGDFSPGNLARTVEVGGAQVMAQIGGATQYLLREEQDTPLIGGLARHGAEKAQSGRRYWQQVALDSRPETETRLGRDVLAGLASLPSTVLGITASVLTGRVEAGAGLLGVLTAGGSYGQGIDAGLDQNRAALYGLLDGTIEAATELVPLRKFLGDVSTNSGVARTMLNQILAEGIGEQAATLGQDFNRWAAIDAPNGKTFEEFVAEIPDHALTTFIASSALASTMSTAGYAVARGAMLMARREATAANAEATWARATELMTLAEASKLRGRKGQLFEQFVAEASEDGPIQDFYADDLELDVALRQETSDERFLDVAA